MRGRVWEESWGDGAAGLKGAGAERMLTISTTTMMTPPVAKGREGR